MKIALATIARRYRLRLLQPTHPADMLTPTPVGGLHMRLEPRH
jgi:cytochrome P450